MEFAKEITSINQKKQGNQIKSRPLLIFSLLKGQAD